MAHLISTDGYTSVVKIEPTPYMMPHPPTHGPLVETYTPTHHCPTTPQIPVTKNEYLNVPQQTRPLSTPQIKTEPADFSVNLQGATDPHILTPSQLPTHIPPTTTSYTPIMKSEPLLDVPLPPVSWKPNTRSAAQRAKRKLENINKEKNKEKRREAKALKALKKQEARAKSREEKSQRKRTSCDLKKKVKYLCQYNKDNPHKILQILLEHYTHEKIFHLYFTNAALKKYIKIAKDNGLLEFNLKMPSAMDTNQPGPSGMSVPPVTRSHGSSMSVAQESSFNVVAEDVVNTHNNQQSLVSKTAVAEPTTIQPLMSIVCLTPKSVTVEKQTPVTNLFTSTTSEASINEQMVSSSVTMEDSNPEQIIPRNLQETIINSRSITSDVSVSNATSNVGTAVEDTSDGDATNNIETAVTMEVMTNNIATAMEDTSESPIKTVPRITVAYFEDRYGDSLSLSLKESVSNPQIKTKNSDFSNKSLPSPRVATEPIGSSQAVTIPPGYPPVVPRENDEGLLMFENVDMSKHKPSRAALVTFSDGPSTSTPPPPHTSPVPMETEVPPTPSTHLHTAQPPVNTESDEEFLYGDSDRDQTPPPDIQLESPEVTQLPPDSQPLLVNPPSGQQLVKPSPGDSDPSIDRLLDLIGQSSNPDPPNQLPLVDPTDQPLLVDLPDPLPLVDPTDQLPLVDPTDQLPLVDPTDQLPLVDLPDPLPLVDPTNQPPLVDLPNQPLLVDLPNQPLLVDLPDPLPLVDPTDQLPLVEPTDQPPLMGPPSQGSEQQADLERDGHQSRDTPPSPERPAHSVLLLEPELQDNTSMLEQAFSILPSLTEWPKERTSKKKKQNQSSTKARNHCNTDTNLDQDSSSWSDEDGRMAVENTKRNKPSTKRSPRIHPFTSSAASNNSDYSSNEDTNNYTGSPSPVKRQKPQISPQKKQPDPLSRTQPPREQVPSNQTSGRLSPPTGKDKNTSSNIDMELGSDTDMEQGSGSDTGMERDSSKQAETKHTRDSSSDMTPPSKKQRVSPTGDSTPSPAHAVSDVINNVVNAEEVIDVDALPDIIVMEHVSPSSDTDVDVGGNSQYLSLFSPQAKIEWSPKRIDKDIASETDQEPAARRQIVFLSNSTMDIADSQDLLVDRTKRAPQSDLLRGTSHSDLLKGTSHDDLVRGTSLGENEIVQVDSPESVAESAVSAKGSPTQETSSTDYRQIAIKLEPMSTDCQLEGAQSISTDKPHSTTPSKSSTESPPSRSSSRGSTPRGIPQRLPLQFSTRPRIKLSMDKAKSGDKSACNRTGELTFGSTPFSQPAYQKLSASNQNEAKQTLLQLREAGIQLTRDFCDRSDKAEALIYRIAHAFFSEEHKLQ